MHTIAAFCLLLKIIKRFLIEMSYNDIEGDAMYITHLKSVSHRTIKEQLLLIITMLHVPLHQVLS